MARPCSRPDPSANRRHAGGPSPQSHPPHGSRMDGSGHLFAYLPERARFRGQKWSSSTNQPTLPVLKVRPIVKIDASESSRRPPPHHPCLLLLAPLPLSLSPFCRALLHESGESRRPPSPASASCQTSTPQLGWPHRQLRVEPNGIAFPIRCTLFHAALRYARGALLFALT